MKLNISSSELLKGLLDVSKAIPAKTTLPILENFLFVLKGGVLEVTASDTEFTLRTEIPAEIEEEGSMAVPARHIIELLKVLPDQPLRIKTLSDSSFECAWASGNSVLPYFPPEDYPEIKTAGESATTVEFPAEVLIEGIASTVYATADDEIHPAMNGIYFDISPESTTLVASDAHKLICYTTPEAKAPAASFILHKKPAAVLRSIVSKADELVRISFDSTTAVFTFGHTLMVCRPVVGKYPRYRDVIPQNNSNILKIDRNLLLGVVRRVAVCADKGASHIKLDLKPGQLEVSAQDLGFALAAYEKIECDYSGDVLTIGFKSTFLSEILSNLDCENIVIKFADARRSVLILPAEGEEAASKVCGILMPIMI